MSALSLWFHSRPPATIERLKKINHAATSSAHIILALTYGLTDPHVRSTNKMIVALLLARHKAQKRGDIASEKRFEARLQDIHDAINQVTGTPAHTSEAAHEAAGNACKRPANFRQSVQTTA
jgi:hypothetical protein